MSLSEAAAVVGIIKDGLTGVAAVLAAFVAFFGLKTWKRQLHGNAEYDLARRLLRTTYKLREAVTSVRLPFISPHETQKALEEAGLKDAPEAERKKRSQEVVYQARWKPLVQARIEFDAEVLEAETLWGNEMQDLGTPIKECIGELTVALNRYLSQKLPKDPQTAENLYDVIHGSEENKFDKKLQEAIKGIETALRPRLKV